MRRAAHSPRFRPRPNPISMSRRRASDLDMLSPCSRIQASTAVRVATEIRNGNIGIAFPVGGLPRPRFFALRILTWLFPGFIYISQYAKSRE